MVLVRWIWRMVNNTRYQYKDHWYCLGDDGAMCKGLITVDGMWYVMDKTGKMLVKPFVLTPDQNGALRFSGLSE